MTDYTFNKALESIDFEHGVELSNVRYNPHGHGDSADYSAKIIIDGVDVGHVSNDGWGGADLIRWNDHEYGDSITAWLMEEWPGVTADDFKYVSCWDFLLHELLNRHLMAKEAERSAPAYLEVRQEQLFLKRLQSNPMYVCDKTGKIRKIIVKRGETFATALEVGKRLRPGAQWLHEMNRDQARTIYMREVHGVQ